MNLNEAETRIKGQARFMAPDLQGVREATQRRGLKHRRMPKQEWTSVDAGAEPSGSADTATPEYLTDLLAEVRGFYEQELQRWRRGEQGNREWTEGLIQKIKEKTGSVGQQTVREAKGEQMHGRVNPLTLNAAPDRVLQQLHAAPSIEVDNDGVGGCVLVESGHRITLEDVGLQGCRAMQVCG